MNFFRKGIIYFSSLPKTRGLKRNFSTLLNLQPLYIKPYQCKKCFSVSVAVLGKNEIPSALSKYELFSEKTAPVVLDVEEERQKVIFDSATSDEFKGFSLERGVAGVFDIVEVVDVLRKEKAEDIFVVKIPPEFNYASYMVITHGRSQVHMTAVCEFIRKLFKKKMNASDFLPIVEGSKSNNWMAIDLGNIVIHMFSKAGREVYDLETLWSVGKEYDSFAHRETPSSDELSTDFAKILASLSPNS